MSQTTATAQPISPLRRRMIEDMTVLKTAHNAGRLQFFGPHTDLADKAAFKAFLEPLYHTKWHVYAKRPFPGPEQVPAYLARYTHRVAISSSRLIGARRPPRPGQALDPDPAAAVVSARASPARSVHAPAPAYWPWCGCAPAVRSGGCDGTLSAKSAA